MRLRLLVFALGSCLGLLASAQDAARLIAQGDSILKTNKPQRALPYYEEALEKQPDATSYVARARAWYVLEHMDSFLLDVERALHLDSTNAEAHYQRSLYAIRSQDPEKAIEQASDALRLGVSGTMRLETLITRGEAHASLGHTDLAIADLQQGLGEDTKRTDALATLARLLDIAGRHEESLSILERLCLVEPDDVGHWINKGYELMTLERYPEAVTTYDMALSIDKDEPTALSNRAYALLKLGREDEAMRDVERSLRAYPSNAFALRTRGILLLHKGERDKACADLNLAKVLGGVPEVDALIQEHCGGVTPKR